MNSKLVEFSPPSYVAEGQTELVQISVGITASPEPALQSVLQNQFSDSSQWLFETMEQTMPLPQL